MKEKRINQILRTILGVAFIAISISLSAADLTHSEKKGSVIPTAAQSHLPVIDISAVIFDQMFEGNANDLVRFELQRTGDTSAGPLTINLAYAGSATTNVDFVTVTNVTFEAG